MGLSNGICNLCNSKRETLYHLFYEYNKIKLLWDYCLHLIKKKKIYFTIRFFVWRTFFVFVRCLIYAPPLVRWKVRSYDRLSICDRVQVSCKREFADFTWHSDVVLKTWVTTNLLPLRIVTVVWVAVYDVTARAGVNYHFHLVPKSART